MTTKKADTTQVQQSIEMANATMEAAKGFWQQILDAQIGGLEQAVAQVEQLSQRGLARAQSNLDEAVKLTRGAMTWMGEMNAEVTKAALQGIKSASSFIPKAAA